MFPGITLIHTVYDQDFEEVGRGGKAVIQQEKLGQKVWLKVKIDFSHVLH